MAGSRPPDLGLTVTLLLLLVSCSLSSVQADEKPRTAALVGSWIDMMSLGERERKRAEKGACTPLLTYNKAGGERRPGAARTPASDKRAPGPQLKPAL
ncbi:hypothetical protein B566_EDAN007507 [Ephemera danica]|nr:hypothetical protein B566_EDAN007507 [Ephemera danica]